MAGHSEELGCPPEILSAIAWYPDDLSREEREAVDSHASECLDCRRELEARLADPDHEAEWPTPDPDATLTRVLARIELGEAEELREWARAPRRTRAVRWLRESEVHVPGFVQPVSVWRGLRVAASFGAAVAAASLFFGAGPDGSEGPPPAELRYEAPRIDVVFRSDLTSAEMAGALEGIHGEIVAGPSRRGRYRIELSPGTSPESAAQALADGGFAVFAEPADPAFD
ncbi:MAG TPA: hypothetical protein VKB65_06695 [Myxococcota bacterium]|nr:hypothetical protein [Myxococcota bacterium]